MSRQEKLFDSAHQKASLTNSVSVSRLEGALVFSAVGDALGWPTEFFRHRRTIEGHENDKRIRSFVAWKKLVGGRFWGYTEEIKPGEYSDDSQLTLSVARCLDDEGNVDTGKFAYLELPLWLGYEKGGGTSVKTAARNLLARRNREWNSNFYKVQRPGGYVDYRAAGANGAAMRILPLAFVHGTNRNRLFKEVFANAICTHGHPRAILGALLYSAAVAYLLHSSPRSTGELLDFLADSIHASSECTTYAAMNSWYAEWNKQPPTGRAFDDVFRRTQVETIRALEAIPKHVAKPTSSYYQLVGALDKRVRGSGTGTVLASLYLFSKYLNEPEDAVLEAVNMIGSDTDTIGYFAGGLFGALYGLSAVPDRFESALQDRPYFKNVAERIANILTGEALEKRAPQKPLDKKHALLHIYAWEVGLHELFWDAIDTGKTLVHPALGRGTVAEKKTLPLRREDYVAKLIKIHFETGQTCTFHSRVSTSSKKISATLSSLLRHSIDLKWLV